MTQPPIVTVPVELAERSYNIHIGENIAANLPQWIEQCLPKCRHAVLIFDAHVAHIADSHSNTLTDAGLRLTHIEVPSGEGSKSLGCSSVCGSRCSASIPIAARRSWRSAAVSSATWQASLPPASRGLPLVQIPTTLLSQVDSSVGGKTGINLPGAKNIVGAFWQPSLVVIDTQSLKSLPRREFVSGLAEVVKYGMILLPDLFDYLEHNAAADLKPRPHCDRPHRRAVVSSQSRCCAAR